MIRKNIFQSSMVNGALYMLGKFCFGVELFHLEVELKIEITSMGSNRPSAVVSYPSSIV